MLRHQDASMANVIGNGVLLVVVWVLCASAPGELFGEGGKYPITKILIGGVVLILIIFAASFFASITEARATKVAIDDGLVVLLSIDPA